MLTTVLLYIDFIMFRYGLEFLISLKLLTWRGVIIYLKFFSASNEMMVWFLFSLFMYWIMLIYFLILYHPWFPGKKPTWLWWMSWRQHTFKKWCLSVGASPYTPGSRKFKDRVCWTECSFSGHKGLGGSVLGRVKLLCFWTLSASLGLGFPLAILLFFLLLFILSIHSQRLNNYFTYSYPSTHSHFLHKIKDNCKLSCNSNLYIHHRLGWRRKHHQLWLIPLRSSSTTPTSGSKAVAELTGPFATLDQSEPFLTLDQFTSDGSKISITSLRALNTYFGSLLSKWVEETVGWG